MNLKEPNGNALLLAATVIPNMKFSFVCKWNGVEMQAQVELQCICA